MMYSGIELLVPRLVISTADVMGACEWNTNGNWECGTEGLTRKRSWCVSSTFLERLSKITQTQSRHPVCRPSSNSQLSEFVRSLLHLASGFNFTREQRKLRSPCPPHEGMW